MLRVSYKAVFWPNLWFLLQMQWPFLIPILVLALALALCTWMKFSVLVERLTSLTAPEALLSPVLLSTHMQEYDAKVGGNLALELLYSWADDHYTLMVYHCKCNLEPEPNYVLLYARTFRQVGHRLPPLLKFQGDNLYITLFYLFLNETVKPI